MYIREDLYKEIVNSMPIPCVDLIVVNEKQQVLLVKRANQPAQGEWWFPGGRVLFMETRRDAALRKLKEECGLQGEIIQEVGTYDLFLDTQTLNPSHGITTVFEIRVNNELVNIDIQSSEYAWFSLDKIKVSARHPFIIAVLDKLNN